MTPIEPSSSIVATENDPSSSNVSPLAPPTVSSALSRAGALPLWLGSLGLVALGLLLHSLLLTIPGIVALLVVTWLFKGSPAALLSVGLFAASVLCGTLGLGLLATLFLIAYVAHNSTKLLGNPAPVVVK